MTRVVLDTNVVVSALLTKSGNEASALRLALSGFLTLCVTSEILAEYRAVLSRPRFKAIPARAIDALLQNFSQGELVAPKFSLAVSPDPTDNRFLECAEAATADYLVTGNKRHFPAEWKKTKIVNARELLEIILLSR